jgi:Dolichyl-phosphate-mannose-protein mannosyltransferase
MPSTSSTFSRITTGRALAVSASLSYLWLCLAWFDHGFHGLLVETPPAIPAVLFFLSVGALLFRHRRRLRVGADGRVALLLALAGLVTRLPFVAKSYGLFSSDAAAQGLMALHVLSGKHHPIFLYNWSYVGSFKAHLTALIAWIIGEPVLSFALAAAFVYAALTAFVYLLGRTVLPRTEATCAGLYVVFAPGFLTAWGMGNEGNYPDVLALGTLMLYLGNRFLKDELDGIVSAFWMGVLGGVAFWIHILATYYLLAALGVLLIHRFGKQSPRRLAVFLAGFVLGDFPGILWNAGNDWLSFRWWSLDASATTAGPSRIERTATQLREVFTTSFAVLSGFWPKESPPSPHAWFRALLLLLIPVSFATFAWIHRRKVLALARGELTPEATCLGFALLVVLVFAQSSFGWMTEEPRYLLFLFSVVPLFVATSLFALGRRSFPAALVVVVALVFVSVRGSLLYYREAAESDAINREFLSRLEALGIRHVHSDYHLSYKYVFLSHGRMIWTSALGPAQTEWYLPFREEVDEADDVALVPRSFRFARRLEKRLDARGIRYRRVDLLYPVLFDFSERIRLEDLR